MPPNLARGVDWTHPEDLTIANARAQTNPVLSFEDIHLLLPERSVAGLRSRWQRLQVQFATDLDTLPRSATVAQIAAVVVTALNRDQQRLSEEDARKAARAEHKARVETYSAVPKLNAAQSRLFGEAPLYLRQNKHKIFRLYDDLAEDFSDLAKVLEDRRYAELVMKMFNDLDRLRWDSNTAVARIIALESIPRLVALSINDAAHISNETGWVWHSDRLENEFPDWLWFWNKSWPARELRNYALTKSPDRSHMANLGIMYGPTLTMHDRILPVIFIQAEGGKEVRTAQVTIPSRFCDTDAARSRGPLLVIISQGGFLVLTMEEVWALDPSTTGCSVGINRVAGGHEVTFVINLYDPTYITWTRASPGREVQYASGPTTAINLCKEFVRRMAMQPAVVGTFNEAEVVRMCIP